VRLHPKKSLPLTSSIIDPNFTLSTPKYFKDRKCKSSCMQSAALTLWQIMIWIFLTSSHGDGLSSTRCHNWFRKPTGRRRENSSWGSSLGPGPKTGQVGRQQPRHLGPTHLASLTLKTCRATTPAHLCVRQCANVIRVGPFYTIISKRRIVTHKSRNQFANARRNSNHNKHLSQNERLHITQSDAKPCHQAHPIDQRQGKPPPLWTARVPDRCSGRGSDFQF
jgi:hypothetical protein